MDLIQQLGPLAFASRLKRLAELLQKDVSQLYQELSVEFEARWFPVVFYLKDRHDIPLTTVAQDLGLTHPAVNQVAGDLENHGLLESSRDKDDDRRRLLNLTKKGRATVRTLEPVWIKIAQATRDLIDLSGCDVLKALEKMERSLNEQPMHDRLVERLKNKKIEA